MNKCNECIFLGVFHDMGASTPLCTRGSKGLVEAITARSDPEPCKWHITKKQVEQLQEQNREAPKFRFTRYDKDLGRYVAPLLYKADGTVMQLCIKCSTNPLTERNRVTIEAEPDLVWGDLIDVLADYENKKEAQWNG